MQPESTASLVTRLCRALSRADGFALYFVLVNLPTARQALSLQVKAQLAQPVIELHVPPEGFGDTTLDGWLLPQLEDTPAESAVFLHGLDNAMPSGREELRRFLQQLNWLRSALKRIARPLVIWLPRHALDSMAEHAPDLYDWYSNVYEFASPEEEAEQLRGGFLTEFNTEVHPAERLRKAEKHQWLHTLAALLDEYPQRNAYRAKLLDDAGHLHRALGNLEDALDLYKQSLAIKQEIGDKAGEGTTLNNISQIYDARGDYHANQNSFTSGGGEQNIAQGDHAIGQQVITQHVTGAGNILSGSGNVTVSNYGVPYELHDELGVTKATLASFFKILEQQQVPRSDLDSKLREIASRHKELRARFEEMLATEPEVARRQAEVRQAIEAGDYAKAEELLTRDMQVIEELQQRVTQHCISAAVTYADMAQLQRIRFLYAKAAEYWQKAATILPEESKKERIEYLNRAGYDFHRIAAYKEALRVWEQSLSISREISDKAGEGITLNNIGALYHVRGDYAAALNYLEQSLSIRQEIGDKAGEGATLNNIGQIYNAKGEYDTALKYLEQSLSISRKIGDKAGEGTTLNNIGQIYDAGGDYSTALTYLHQSLSISREIGDTAGEAETIWNIGRTYENQSDLSKTEPYFNRAVQLAEEIGHPLLEEWREALERVRAKLRGK